MKLYNSYIKTNQDGDVKDLIFIKNGFSFTALIFNFMWFIYHNMYKSFFLVAVLDIILIEIISLNNIGFVDVVIIWVSTSLILAANANYWHSKYLATKGYKFIGCVFGKNKESAKLRFVEGYLDSYDEDTIKKYKFLNKEDRQILKRKRKDGKSFFQMHDIKSPIKS